MTDEEKKILHLMQFGCTRDVAINALAKFHGDVLRSVLWISDNGLYVSKPDLQIVMAQTGCDADTAKDALLRAGNDLAKAITIASS